MSGSHFPSLKDRIVRASSVTSRNTSDSSSSGRSGQYKLWDDINMDKAIALCDNGSSVRHAAELCGVPKSTLYDRMSGKVKQGAKPGPDPYLTVEEEEELASFLCKCAKIGYPHTQKQVLGLVQVMLNNKGIQASVTNGWWERFSKRQNLKLRTAVPLSYARAMATDEDTLNRYYDMLEDALSVNQLFDKPACIFNCDETGLPLSPKSVKVVNAVGCDTSCVTGNDKSQITVLACASATGRAIPPFVIYDRQTLNPELTRNEVPGTMYGLSSKGWIDRSLFSDWFFHHFLLYIPSARPVLLLMDGHSSHYSPEVIRAAAAEKVILFTLPPHTTHLTQPLDKGCFSPLKVAWRERCHEFYAKNPGRVISRYDFSTLFSQVWMKAMSMSNIISSFRTTGIYPFSRKVVDNLAREKFSSFKPESLPDKSGLAYIPLYSPARPRTCRDVAQQDSAMKQFNLSVSSDLDGSPVSVCSCSYVQMERTTAINKFLKAPVAPNKQPTKYVKSSGRVLTSAECIKEMEDKERMKQEKAQLKEQKQKAREEKKREKALIARADKVLQSLRRPPSKTDASLTPSSSALLPLVDSMKGRKRNVRKAVPSQKTSDHGTKKLHKDILSDSSCDDTSELSLDIGSLTFQDSPLPASTKAINTRNKQTSTRVTRSSEKALLRWVGTHDSHNVTEAPIHRNTLSTVKLAASGVREKEKTQPESKEAPSCRNTRSTVKLAASGVRDKEKTQPESKEAPIHRNTLSTVKLAASGVREKEKTQPESKVYHTRSCTSALSQGDLIKDGDTGPIQCVQNASSDAEFEDLSTGAWLETSTVVAYQQLLKKKFAIGGLDDPAYGQEYAFSTQRGHFVQVLHVNGNHWLCASNVLSVPGHIQIYDSIYDEVTDDTVSQVCSIVRSKRRSIKLEIVDVQKQKGSNDCGLFALAFATTICFGECPSTKVYCQAKMRKHLAHCFRQSSPFPFPTVESTKLAQRSWKVVRVNVFCHSQCRLPETTQMVCCDKCQEWFHDECDNVEPEVWMDDDYSWYCRLCKKKLT